MQDLNFVLTADIGGSHITTAVYDRSNQCLLDDSLTRKELRSKGTAEHILCQWSDCIAATLAKTKVQVRAMGVAMPGPFDYQNGISYITGLNKYDSIYGMNIKHFFAQLLGIDPEHVRFMNDAQATVAGEVLSGAAKGVRKVFGVTLGTGFGSAYHDETLTEDLDLAQRPYKDSIADNYLSTRWFLKRYYDLTGMSAEGVAELAAFARESWSVKKIFREFGFNMNDFLRDPLGERKPELLLVCGGISSSFPLFLSGFNRKSPVRVAVGKLGEKAALIGAGGLFV